jgi:hypothetical protein
MHIAARRHDTAKPRAQRVTAVWLTLMALCLALLGAPAARAGEPELAAFELVHNEEGLLLSYSVNMELSRSVDEALTKGVALFFVAEAEVFRSRFYWRDLRVARASRVWRIVYVPLTSTYKVTFLGLSQSYNSKEEALAAISRAARWKIAEPAQIEEGSRHYVEFSFRLDTSLLPRPLQIGVGGQADWAIAVQRTQKIN